MTTFFDPNCNETSSFLPEEEAYHAIKALRLRMGEEFDVINGNGLKLHCKVTTMTKRSLEYEILHLKRLEKKKPSLHLAISPLKQADRFEFILEKATELGVDTITPIICQRTEKPHVKHARLMRIIISAMKQSGNAFLPKLEERRNFNDFINLSSQASKLIAHCEDSEKKALKEIDLKRDIVFLIGPEGDFTSEEIDMAIEKGFEAIDLGDLTLRAETAAIGVTSYIQLLK